MHLRWKAALTAAALSFLSLSGTGIATAAPRPAAQPTASASKAAPALGADRVADPDHVLTADWRSSIDRAVTVSGDGSGLHVLVADSKDAYKWRTATTLSEPGVTEDAWVGNVCVTGSGRRAVVAYAPRTFTDNVDTFDRGAFAAVVDLDSGAVTKLPVTTTLAYFSPGCGTGETAVLTQANATTGKTRLITVDAATGKVTRLTTVGGQATSAVPLGDGIVAAIDDRLVGVSRTGAETTLTATSGPAFNVHVDAAGAVAFMDRAGNSSTAKRYSKGSVAKLASGELGSFALAAGSGGHLFMTGKPSKSSALPSTMAALPVDPAATVSTEGRIAVVNAAPISLQKRIAELGSVDDPSQTDPVTINAVTAKGAPLAFEARTDDNPSAMRQGGVLSPALGGGTTAPSAKKRSVSPSDEPANATVTVDENRTCAVARNDPETQIYQPTPNQAEWAVDDAVRGDLTSTAPIPVVRPANWKGSELGAWSPQNLFPSLPLYGSNRQVIPGGRVPAQVLLGILVQESNLWQASGHDLAGQYGNPLVSNFYGTTVSTSPGFQDSSWAINWAKADCGTGIGQVTDGMRLSDTTYTTTQQREIAIDYATNIAASLQILEQKWNELNQNFVPMVINNDDPSSLENWFAALWDYNEGFNPPSSSGNNTPWGLGWGNNPANPKYPPTRHAFLDDNSYSDAAHPQDWPYEEKVLGPAGRSTPAIRMLTPACRTTATRTATRPPGGTARPIAAR